jgi:hypothetical protein
MYPSSEYFLFASADLVSRVGCLREGGERMDGNGGWPRGWSYSKGKFWEAGKESRGTMTQNMSKIELIFDGVS